MTKYNTGNPVGSADPRDLHDDATVADSLVNGDRASYPDRLGKSRKSWRGIESEFAEFIAAGGYVGTGTNGAVENYASGITITGYNQIIRDTSGEFWRLSGPVTLPYTTTGAGLPEGGKFVAVGDAALRQQLNGTLGSGLGAYLVRGASIYADSIAELESFPDPITGQSAVVGGSQFVWTGTEWKVSGQLSAHAFGLFGSTSASSWQAAIDKALEFGAKSFSIPFDVETLDGPVDCKEVRLICDDTILPSSLNTFVNHGGIVRGVIAGVNTSKSQINLTERPSFNKSKIIRRDGTNDFTVFMAKKNPSEGILEVSVKENVVTNSNSIGGNCAPRITHVRNIGDLVAYQHAFNSANHTPVDTVERGVPTGTGASGGVIKFWDIPSGGGVIRFDSNHILEEVSILFLLSGGSSDSVEVRWAGTVIDTISLAAPSGAPEWFIYRRKVVPGNSQITLVNNGASTAYVAGVNAYRPGEEMSPSISLDTVAYRYNLNDYSQQGGAVDYAFRRHPDAYSGTDPTGGSYHGGENVVSQSVRLDGGSDWASASTIGDLAVAKRIEFVTNVDVVWPSDLAEVNVVRLNQIGDGAIFKDVRVIAGDMVFDAAWLTMWTTPAELVSVRGLTPREISGVSSEFRCYDRGNEVRQDLSVNFGVRNSWTLFDDERNSNGGVYIASESGTRSKLYYGPILFNKGKLGTVHTQQVTEFFGKG